MSKAGQIVKIVFVFILPVTLVLHFISLFISYDAHYYYQGNKYEARLMEGFPFPENGLFYDINGMFTSGNSTTNWTYYFLNKIIILVISFVIYYFVFRKISFSGKTKVFTLSFMTIIYLFFGWMTFVFTSMQIKYDYGNWPDKIEIENIHWKKP
jgi:hypothetical protein